MASDPNTTRGLARSAFADRAGRVFAGLSTVALVLMMAVTFAGVVMRYFFNAPILGSNELTEMISVALVMLAMPYATLTNAHVCVDVLDNAIGRFGRFLGDLVSRGLGIFVLGTLVSRMWGRLEDAREFEDATNTLDIPLWPFYGLAVLGMSLFVLVLAAQVIDTVRAGFSRHE